MIWHFYNHKKYEYSIVTLIFINGYHLCHCEQCFCLNSSLIYDCSCWRNANLMRKCTPVLVWLYPEWFSLFLWFLVKYYSCFLCCCCGWDWVYWVDWESAAGLIRFQTSWGHFLKHRKTQQSKMSLDFSSFVFISIHQVSIVSYSITAYATDSEL